MSVAHPNTHPREQGRCATILAAGVWYAVASTLEDGVSAALFPNQGDPTPKTWYLSHLRMSLDLPMT